MKRKVISKTSPNIQKLAADLRATKQPLTRDEQFQLDAAAYAKTSIANIREMVEALDATGQDWQAREDAQQRILEDALSVEVRSGWYTLDADADKAPAEYNILITTGGPAARIIGELDEHGLPTTARFEYQDWFQPWTDVTLTREDSAVLLRYAQQFYFGGE